MKNRFIKKAFTFTLLFTLIILKSFSASKTDKAFEMVENKSTPVKEIRKEISKNSYLYKATQGKDKENLLMIALKADRSIEVITMLLDAGIDPTAKTKSGKTSLMYACQFSTDVNVVEKVLTAGTFLNSAKKKRIIAKDKGGQTSFDYARNNSDLKTQEEIIKLLSKYAKDEKAVVKEKTENEDSAIENSTIEESKESEENKSDEAIKETSITESVTNTEIVKNAQIENKEASVEQNTSEETVTSETISNNTKEDLITAIEETLYGKSVSIVDEKPSPILSEINLKNDLGKTKLIEAVENGNLEIVKDLLSLGANVDVSDNDGNTALMYAAKNKDNSVNIEIIDILLLNNANFRKKNDEGMTALMIAASFNNNSEVIDALLEYRLASELDVKEAFIKSIINDAPINIIKTFVNKGLSVNTVVNDKSALIYAAESNSKTDIIEYLLKSGASKYYRTIEGKSAAYFAKLNSRLPHDNIYNLLLSR